MQEYEPPQGEQTVGHRWPPAVLVITVAIALAACFFAGMSTGYNKRDREYGEMYQVSRRMRGDDVKSQEIIDRYNLQECYAPSSRPEADYYGPWRPWAQHPSPPPYELTEFPNGRKQDPEGKYHIRYRPGYISDERNYDGTYTVKWAEGFGPYGPKDSEPARDHMATHLHLIDIMEDCAHQLHGMDTMILDFKPLPPEARQADYVKAVEGISKWLLDEAKKAKAKVDPDGQP